MIIRIAVLFVVILAGCSQGTGTAELRIDPDVVYGHKAGLALTFDVYRPASQNGAAVLFINSGGFRSPDFSRQCVAEDGDLWGTGATALRLRTSAETEPPVLRQVSFEKLLAAGFTVFDIRHGSAPQFKLDEMVVDCRRAVKTIRRDADRFGVDADRLGVWGCSAGGYLAGHVAFAAEDEGGDADDSLAPVSAAVQAAALYYPAGYDLTEFPFLLEHLTALHLPTEVLDRLSLEHFISAEDPPTLILWGDVDKDFITKPAGEIRTGLEEAGVPVETVVYPGIGHTWRNGEGVYDAAIGEQALEAVVDWFGERLAED